MGERFEVGQRVRVTNTWLNLNILLNDVGVVDEDPGGANGILVVLERTRSLHSFARDYLEPAPADPPSVGVPVSLAGIRIEGNVVLGEHDRRTEETKLADDLCEFLHPFAGETGQNEGARDTLGRLVGELRASRAAWTDTQKPGDVLGERDRLRREKADLETQVAYLSRELVLAKARAKGAR